MKREYFGAICLIVLAVLVIGGGYVFGNDVIADKLHAFIVIWFLIAYLLGQYSTRFPKAF